MLSTTEPVKQVGPTKIGAKRTTVGLLQTSGCKLKQLVFNGGLP